MTLPRPATGRRLAVLLLGLLAACQNAPTARTEPLPQPTATVGVALLPSPDPPITGANPTPPGDEPLPGEAASDQFQVRVWWPDELYPPEASRAQEILDEQFQGFRQTYDSYELIIRRKRANGMGGILPTLRTAGPVAPGALPDLTLMRRADLVTAASEGLIVPLEDWVPPDILANLFPGASALGAVDGVLYGVPYALNIVHTAYRASLLDQPLLTFESVLEQAPRYAFPAGAAPNTQVSLTLLIQYLAAGGRLVDDTGLPVLDPEPLRAVLSYYERGVSAGLFDPTLLTYNQYDGYWSAFVAGEASVVGVDTTTLLTHRGDLPHVGLAPIPSLDGTPLTALDGWMWVLTTQDPDHQRQARAFLSWMMRINPQSLFSEALGILPSQERALHLWEDGAYADFALALLPYAQVIPAEQQNSLAATALQESLIAVLNGTPAADAVSAALARLSGGG